MEEITLESLYDEIEHAATIAVPVFKLFGWTYWDADNITIEVLKKTIRNLVSQAIDYYHDSEEENPEVEIGTGRFIVKLKKYDGEVRLDISLDLGGKSWF